ncbi:MAG: GntR family transcriptional regulator [Chloroflexi bacterium]|nr:GntR family transcriptional regulator [Chloroflexota bacterium]MCI0576151.1 GntR family transcriptional regulator [Chloroflexota bacterium]MCI0645420.1 GntR family transcriptional regulator [Chloroflexota bacterium]MCI0731286.1 GntR family transcriptional regulator [Chloroflexota bacterium]
MSTLFRSKNEVVYDLLHKSIIQGEYRPGERMVIDELAGKLGVSQIPIREALRQLEADGFVSIEPYVGATVTEISADFIFEIFALLETMEAACSRTACRCMSQEELETLADLVRQMDACVADHDRWSEQNKRFHLLISDYAHTGLIRGMMEKVLDHWDRLRLHYLKDVLGQRIATAQEEHRQIMAAFRRRNTDEVERLIRAHNQNALASYIEHLRLAGHLAAVPEGC